MTYYCLTCSHLDRVAQSWFEHQMTSLKKWELGRLAEKQTEARESCEDRLVADPENATISVIGACILSIHGWFEVKPVQNDDVIYEQPLTQTTHLSFS